MGKNVRRGKKIFIFVSHAKTEVLYRSHDKNSNKHLVNRKNLFKRRPNKSHSMRLPMLNKRRVLGVLKTLFQNA